VESKTYSSCALPVRSSSHILPWIDHIHVVEVLLYTKKAHLTFSLEHNPVDAFLEEPHTSILTLHDPKSLLARPRSRHSTCAWHHEDESTVEGRKRTHNVQTMCTLEELECAHSTMTSTGTWHGAVNMVWLLVTCHALVLCVGVMM